MKKQNSNNGYPENANFLGYKLTIAYDGTDFHGWQEQDSHLPTIVSTLRTSFAYAFQQELQFLVGSSRTDTGVHALGQVARIKIPFSIEPDQLMNVWNRVLPNSISITNIEPIDASFHPQHNVVNKTYWYHLFDRRPLPFVARYGWFYDRRIDMNRLKQALSIFVGTHDFRSFVTGDDRDSTIRTINSIDIEWAPEFGAHRIIVQGPSFLRYMIRRIVGASVQIATSKKIPVNSLEQILQSKNPRQDLLTAPAQGLILKSIKYTPSRGTPIN